jgi:hypothetical protein
MKVELMRRNRSRREKGATFSKEIVAHQRLALLVGESRVMPKSPTTHTAQVRRKSLSGSFFAGLTCHHSLSICSPKGSAGTAQQIRENRWESSQPEPVLGRKSRN